MKDTKTFNSGDWIVCKTSFGVCTIQMSISGTFDNCFLRHASDQDFRQIETAVFDGGKFVYRGRFPHKGFETPQELLDSVTRKQSEK